MRGYGIAAASSPRQGFGLRLAVQAAAISSEFWKYLAASAIALAADFGLLWLLTERAGLHYLASSAISYSAGALLHYAISATFVFDERRLNSRRAEFLGFFAIGLLGLAASQLVIKASVDGLGLSYLAGKLAATAVSFVLTFATRRAVLFTKSRLGG